MIKLRTILLCNFPYYIILFIALLYFLITNFFIVYKSNYDEISSINAKIIDITIKDYGIKLTLKNKEKLIGYLYLEKEQKEEFLNNYSYGDIVYIKTEELELLFGKQETAFGQTNFGTSNVYDGYKINVSINDFFSNHFAILGNSGAGKSCTVAPFAATSLLVSTPVVEKAMTLPLGIPKKQNWKDFLSRHWIAGIAFTPLFCNSCVNRRLRSML